MIWWIFFGTEFVNTALDTHEDVMTWRRYPHYWPFMESYGHRWILLTKDQTTRSFDIFFVVNLR